MEDVLSVYVPVLNDLILINNDRVTGYQKAIDQLPDKDNDLKVLFEGFISQSQTIAQELQQVVESAGSFAEEGTTFEGKMYRAWMDVKAVFTDIDRKSILAACERGEDAAQSAYKDALNVVMPADIFSLLERQKADLKRSHDTVKALRDSTD